MCLPSASSKHHATLRELGAKKCFDYTDPDVVDKILYAATATASHENKNDNIGTGIPYIVGCIGSVEATLRPLSKIARTAKWPSCSPSLYDMPQRPRRCCTRWMSTLSRGSSEAEGVELSGVRTHFYMQDEFWREKLLPEMMPALVAEGKIMPNKVRTVEGSTLLTRAERALEILRGREVSGEKLVWRVSEEE